MTRIPNSNTLVGAVLDGLQTSTAISACGKLPSEDADNRIGELLADHLELTIDKDWNADSFLTVTPKATYGEILRSLRNDIHVDTVMGNYEDRDFHANASILDHSGRAIAVVQALYDWRSEDVAAILKRLETLQYLCGLPLAVLAVALPYTGSDESKQHERIRQEIEKDFGPYSGRLDRYVNPVVTFSGCQTIVGNAATHWTTCEHLSSYTACCIYYPFGESGVISPFDKPTQDQSAIH